jgi:flavin-dependent dehydrogenase
MKVAYSIPIRECYSGSLNLEKEYFHWFFPRGCLRPRFNVNHKGDCFLIEGSGIRELREDIHRLLSGYGFDPAPPPAWKDGCLIPKLHGPLLSGSFSPARGNVLLVGDAAGLIFPITFEGIGSALKSGLLAAEAVREASQTGRKAAGVYLRQLQPVLQTIETLRSCQENLFGTTAASAPELPFLAESIKSAYEKTLRLP